MNKKLRFLPLFLIILSTSSTPIFSQSLGISSTGAEADPSAALDVSATNQGVLVPRVALTATHVAAPVTSPATSLLVYNTATAGTAPNEVVPGYYYWTGSGWQRLLTQADTAPEGWGLTGNSGTNPATHFLGTADNQPLVLKANGKGVGLLPSTGAGNLLLGYQAGLAHTSGEKNTAIGNQSLFHNNIQNNLVAVGYRALYHNGLNAQNSKFGIYNTAVGSEALFSNTIGNFNSALGRFALYSNTIGNQNSAVGTMALYSNTTGTANSTVGHEALFSNTDGSLNSAVGTMALYKNTTGSINAAVGYEALYNNTAGGGNTAVGYEALYSNNIGNLNTAVGRSTLYNNTYGGSNTAVGIFALYSNTTGSENSAIGYEALNKNVTGSYNAVLGNAALFNNTSGSINTAVGAWALRYNSTGNYNTAIGNNAGPTYGNFNLSNTSALGNEAAPTASNHIRIGNTAITNISGQVAWSNTSDQRFKVDVQENVKGLDFILKLRPVTYQWDIDSLNRFIYGKAADTLFADSVALAGIATQESITYTGFLAQEVEAAAQSVGYDFSGVVAPVNDKTPYSIRYAEFVVPLVKAVQEQQSQLGHQNGLLAGLSSRLDRPVVKLTSASEWADRVFEPGYRLRSLGEVEQYMQQHKHLPGVPSAQELAEKGVDVATMLSKQMEKIEELTLYVVELEKKNKVIEEKSEKLQQLEAENQAIRQVLFDLQKEVQQLSDKK